MFFFISAIWHAWRRKCVWILIPLMFCLLRFEFHKYFNVRFIQMQVHQLRRELQKRGQPFNDSQRLLSTISKVGKNNESTSNNRVLGFWSESTKTEGKKEPCLIWSMMLSQETVAKRRIQQERSSALFLWHSKRVQVTNKPGSCNSQGAYPCLAMPSLNLLSHVLLQI